MSLLAAVALLTVIPIRVTGGPEVVGRGSAWYPLVGALLGGFLWAAYLAMRLVLPPLPARALVLVLLAIVTGGIHLDGLADTVDGLTGGRGKEALAIMRDPHVGALGAVAVALLLVCKLAFLASLDEVAVGRVLVVMAAVGRWAPVFAAFRYPYAREAGTGKAVADHARGGQLLLATVLAAASALVLGWRGLLLFAAGAVATVALSAYLARRIGGHTGDTYGFLVEVVEGIVLLGATI